MEQNAGYNNTETMEDKEILTGYIYPGETTTDNSGLELEY